MLADPLRRGTSALLSALRRLGVDRIVLATGDRRDVAEAVARDLGFDAVNAELTPDRKIMVVLAERKYGPVMMIGDGVNDAPALAAADVGVAMGARGAAASSRPPTSSSWSTGWTASFRRSGSRDARGASRSKASMPASACR